MSERVFWGLVVICGLGIICALKWAIGIDNASIGIIFSTLTGPIIALQAQKMLENWRDSKNRRIQLFKVLMATRAATISPGHVEALNSIDLEFQDSAAFKPTRTAWRIYLDHLNNYPKGEPAKIEAEAKHWGETSSNLLTKLLLEMATALKFSFDEVDIKRGVYSPTGHATDENEQRFLRMLLIRTFAGDNPLKMNVVGFPSDADTVKAHRSFMDGFNSALKDGKLAVDVNPPK